MAAPHTPHPPTTSPPPEHTPPIPTPLMGGGTPAPHMTLPPGLVDRAEHGWHLWSTVSVVLLPAVLAMLVSWTRWNGVTLPPRVPARNRVAVIWALVAIVTGSAAYMSWAEGAPPVLFALLTVQWYLRVVWVALLFVGHRFALAVAVAFAALALLIAQIVFYFKAAVGLGVFMLIFSLVYATVETAGLVAIAFANRQRAARPVSEYIPDIDDSGPLTSADAQRQRKGNSAATID